VLGLFSWTGNDLLAAYLGGGLGGDRHRQSFSTTHPMKWNDKSRFANFGGLKNRKSRKQTKITKDQRYKIWENTKKRQGSKKQDGRSRRRLDDDKAPKGLTTLSRN